MAFWAYILKCADGRYYTGHTDNLERRVAEHQAGGYCDYTSRRLPVTLVWAQDFPSRIEALGCELRVKKWSQAKKEALANGQWDMVSHYAKPPGERGALDQENLPSLVGIDRNRETAPPSPVRLERSRETDTPRPHVSTSLDTNGGGGSDTSGRRESDANGDGRLATDSEAGIFPQGPNPEGYTP